MSDLIKSEEELANPEVGQLLTPRKFELDEARKICLYIVVKAFEAQPGIAQQVDLQIREKLRKRIFETSYEELCRRIEAVSIQNPGMLVDALKAAGYGVEFDGMGNVGICPEGDPTGGLGSYITEQQFEGIKV